MLALNKALQKIGKRFDIQSCRVKYASSGGISVYLITKPM